MMNRKFDVECIDDDSWDKLNLLRTHIYTLMHKLREIEEADLDKSVQPHTEIQLKRSKHIKSRGKKILQHSKWGKVSFGDDRSGS
jgi:hypothetical protein